jgi:ketosteroid isomerase-like protein
METAIQTLEQRVQRLEDLEAIQSAWRDYLFALDSHDYEALADVFTEDGAVEMVGLDSYQPGQDRTYHGRESIIDEFYRPVVDEVAAPHKGNFYTGHHGTNMEIELEGDEATTLAYFFEILGNTQMLIGTYQHRFVREPDRWRIAYLRIAIRYRAVIEAQEFGGLSLSEVRAMDAV